MGKHNDAKTPNVTEGRHLGIGGSDCYTLCHGKPDDVDRLWFEKLKLVDPVDLSDNFRVRLGTYTEEFNRKIFFEKILTDRILKFLLFLNLISFSFKIELLNFFLPLSTCLDVFSFNFFALHSIYSVSYTHLTLPTSDLV